MPKTTTELLTIIKLGGGVSIDASKKTASELQTIAKLTKTSGTMLIIRNADVKTAIELQSIAKFAPGKIIFEI